MTGSYFSKRSPCRSHEEWRSVVGYEGLYEVSSLGNVRSVDRTVTRTINGVAWPVRCKGKLRKPFVNDSGYLCLMLCRDGIDATKKVHALVAEAFLGPCPPDAEVAHNDGIHTNNILSNLRYTTHKDNIADQKRHGTMQRGSKHYRTSLTEADVRDIRNAAGTVSVTALAERYECSPSAISRIIRRKNWSHIS